MPVELPTDDDTFHALLRRRLRDQSAIDAFRTGAARVRAGATASSASASASTARPHVVGQTGCFCLDCLVHRRQEWRVGSANAVVVGPRDQWKQFAWGDSERQALGATAIGAAAPERQPVVTPTIREQVTVWDARQRPLVIERDAKFTAVASGKYHTLMLSESAGVFACGDNTYGALGRGHDVVDASATPRRVDLSHLAGDVMQIAASAYASFALIALPPTDAKVKRQIDQARPLSRPGLFRLKSIDDFVGQLKQEDAVYNHVVSWGRADRGVLGRGDSAASFDAPRAIDLFTTMRVLQISAGAQHILVLTEMHGVHAFGDGSHGKLGHGDTTDRSSPVRIQSLDGLNVQHVSAGDEHSIAVTGETVANRQVYSWGLGRNGRLGHNDEQTRLKPTRLNHFRGRKVISVVAGGAHNLATSEMPDGVSVWSWGAGTYGQLGHRDTWDAWLPRSVDEIRRQRIQFVDAGQAHSVALSETRRLWLWGKGIHGSPGTQQMDPASSCIVQPIKVELPGIEIISARAGRGRTFVWGDRAVDRMQNGRTFGGSIAAKVCCALPVFESLTSDSFRIVYRCGGCGLGEVCIACAHNCHAQHCLELGWTLEDTLSRECGCFSSGKCMFDIERGVDTSEIEN